MDVYQVEKELSSWHQRKYDRTNIDSKKTMQKLLEEVVELGQALAVDDRDNVSEECADIVFVLCHIVRERGTYSLNQAIASKLRVLAERLEAEGK